MAFRVLILGGRERVAYPLLRDALDTLLAKRLPDVEVVTPGGPGVPALAASYARSRGLPVTVIPSDLLRHPGDAEERQVAELLALADAVVAVWDGGSAALRDLLSHARARGKPVAVVGGPARRGKLAEPVEVPEPWRRWLPPD